MNDKRMPWRILGRALAVVACAALVSTQAHGGTTGKISGTVEEKGKAVLPGVTILVEGTHLGANADERGQFNILNVPAGTYTLRAKMIGYADYVLNNVVVTPDFTTSVTLSMSSEAIQQAPVVVESTRPLIQKDATGTARFLSKDDIQNLPTRGYRDAASLQTGVVNFQRNIDRENQNTPTLIVRGGRPNEVAYYVDGMSQQDPLTGNSTTNISNNAIDEVVVLTGGFNAEYGKVSSGVINVVTREGGSKLFGSLETVSDAPAGSWIGTHRYDYNLYDAAIGGPVKKGSDKLTFYGSGERRWEGDRAPRVLAPVFENALQTQLGVPKGRLPNDGLSGWTWQGKLAWRPSSKTNVKLGTLGSRDDWREFTQAYLFDEAHSPRYLDKNASYFATINQTMSAKAFWTLSANFFQTERIRGDGLFFDNLGLYAQPDGNPTFDPGRPYFWSDGHVFDDFLRRKSQYWGLKGDYTDQVNRYHQLKAGAEFQRHTLRYFDSYFPTELTYTGGQIGGRTQEIDRYGYSVDGKTELNGGLDGAKHPKTASLYLQDKFEREGVIVNAGLRGDYINVNTPSLRSETFPLGPSPDQTLDPADLQASKTYFRASPRLGVAFPVTDRTLLRVNYGQFFQQVSLQDLYVSYQFLEHKIRTGGYYVGFGNPNLKPERTTAYEVGMAHQLGERARLDVTAYYKDVKDLVEVETIHSNPNAFASYRNKDFATIKGVDIGWVTRAVNHLSGQVNYSLSYAEGTGSVSDTQRNPAWTNTETPKQTAPLDFDQRHKLSLEADYRLGNNEGPRYLHNFGINVIANLASGTPYTPVTVYDEVTLAAVATQPTGPINSRYGPWTRSVDLKATKGFRVSNMNLSASLWVLNVFDAKNVVDVYHGTGAAASTGFLATASGQAFLANNPDDGQALYDLAQNQPGFYSNPRLVRFGVKLDF